MTADTVTFLFFGFIGVAVMGAAAVSLFCVTGTGFLRLPRIAFRFAVMSSSGALGIYWLSLLWRNPPNVQFLALLGEYVSGPLLSWVFLFLAFPVIEAVLLSRSAANRRKELGIDFGLAVAHFVSAVLLFLFLFVFSPLFATE